MSSAAARCAPFRSASTRLRTGSRERLAVPFRAGTDSRTFACRLEKRDDVTERRARAEQAPDPRLLRPRAAVVRNTPAGRDDDVARLALLEELHDLGEERHVRAAQAGEADRVDVFLDRGFYDVLPRLPQTGVDDLHARVPQGASHDLG